jgi:hypothetical protein
MRLKDELNNFITEYSTWVVYLRRDTRFRCPVCFDADTQEGKSLCPRCYGTGYKTVPERVPVRIARPRALGYVPDTGTPYGHMSNYEFVAYFQREYYPEKNDKIVEVSWNVAQSYIQTLGQVAKVLHVYNIDEMEAWREDEISFLVAGCSIDDTTKEFIEYQLISRGIA